LGQAYPCFPAGTTHLAVVDPGVGSTRRPLLVQAHGQRFVAPDNGLLTFPLNGDPRHKAREISAKRCFRQPVSNTFHGRDIFAPIAAHVAGGLPAARIGMQILDPVRLAIPRPVEIEVGLWAGHIVYVDRFGNLVTSFRTSEMPKIAWEPFELVIGGTTVSLMRETYAGAPEAQAVAIGGSSGYIEVSMNQGNASVTTGAASGTAVTLRFGKRGTAGDSTLK
jgi:S-adenosylmethionine hydrolase